MSSTMCGCCCSSFSYFLSDIGNLCGVDMLNGVCNRWFFFVGGRFFVGFSPAVLFQCSFVFLFSVIVGSLIICSFFVFFNSEYMFICIYLGDVYTNFRFSVSM